MKVLVGIVLWILFTFPLALLLGAFIRFGMGEDQEDEASRINTPRQH